MFPTRRILICGLCLLLLACGNKGPLTPAPAPDAVPAEPAAR